MQERRDENNLNNEWYTSRNPYYLNGYGLPNCAAYAWGRISEILGEPINTCNGNAITFAYEPDFIPISEPVAGSIMVWGEGYFNCGHVAVVEHVYKDGSIDISDSSYGGYNFKITRLYPNNNYYNGDSTLSFEGFFLHKKIEEQLEKEYEIEKEKTKKFIKESVLEVHPFLENFINNSTGMPGLENGLLIGAICMQNKNKNFRRLLSKIGGKYGIN